MSQGQWAGGTSWSTTPEWTLVLDPTVHQSTPEYTGCIGQSESTPEYARVHWSTLEYITNALAVPQCRGRKGEVLLCTTCGTSQSTPEYTGCIGQSWSTPEYARVHRSTLEYTGVHWRTLEYTGVHKSTLECTGVHWSTLEYPGVH